MNLIRQYLKQKVVRLFTGRKIDIDLAKKELRDELSHLLYDQTRRTPIIIPVINEIGGSTQNGQPAQKPQGRPAPPAPFAPKVEWSEPVPSEEAEAPHLAGRSPRDL